MSDNDVNAAPLDPRPADPDAPQAWLARWPALCVVGQVGQSLDGRVATPNGHSHYINGLASRVFLHQLRAAVDGVIVGAGTALADAPQLTVRHAPGTDPARVIIDPRGRVPLDNPVFRDDGTRVIRVVDAHTPTHAWPSHIDVLAWPINDGGLDPQALVTALQAQGLKRLLVEGGPTTLSGFIQANALNYVYAMIAPLIIGSGPTGWVMPEIDHLDQALRLPMRSMPLDDELLIELDFARMARGGASQPT